MQPLENYFVLGENIFRVQTHKVFLIRLAMKLVRARNPASNVLVPETGDARHHYIRVHHGTLFSLARLRPQW